MKRRIGAVAGAILVTAGLLWAVFKSVSGPVQRKIFSMDTIVEMTAYGKHAEDAVNSLTQSLREMERWFSRTIPESQISKLNQSAGHTEELDPPLEHLLRASLYWNRETGGLFDITIAPIADLWGFTREQFQVPPSSDMERTMAHVGMEHLHFGLHSVTLDPGTQLDLGGIAKGYGLEKANDIFDEWNVKHAVANLGGDILLKGNKPDGGKWTVAVQDPYKSDGMIGTLQLADRYILTSGNYQRYFDEDGVRYCHMIDPITGSAAGKDLVGVTVVSELKEGGGEMCDCLSTALFLMGRDDAVRYWKTSRLPFEMILVAEDGSVLITEGLRDCFSPLAGSTYRYKFIS